MHSIHPTPTLPCAISEDSISFISDTTLFLAGGSIQKISAGMRHQLQKQGPFVKTLSFYNYDLSTKDLQDIANYFPNLELIEWTNTTLDNCKILDMDVIKRYFFPQHKNLKIEFKKMEQNPVRLVTPEMLLASALVRSDGDFSVLSRVKLQEVSAIGHQISVVDLRGYKLTSKGLALIARICSQMETLLVERATLDGNPIISPYAIDQLLSPKKVTVILDDEKQESEAKVDELKALTSSVNKLSLQTTTRKKISKSKKAASKPTLKSKAEQDFIQVLQSLNLSQTTQVLDLRSLAICSSIPNWVAIVREHYPDLYLLHLPVGSILDETTGKELSRFKNLKELDIAYCDKKDMRGLTHLTRLQGLYNERTFEDNARAFMTFKEEEKIQFHHRSLVKSTNPAAEVLLQTFDPDAMSLIGAMKQLRILRLGEVKGIGDRALIPLLNLTKLEDFSISTASVTNKGLHSLKASANTLQKLNLIGCTKLNDSALYYIIEAYPALRELRIGENDFTPLLLQTLSQFNSLTTLVLGTFKNIPEKHWKKLPAACPHVEKFSLIETHPITPYLLKIWRSQKSMKFYKLVFEEQSIVHNALEHSVKKTTEVQANTASVKRSFQKIFPLNVLAKIFSFSDDLPSSLYLTQSNIHLKLTQNAYQFVSLTTTHTMRELFNKSINNIQPIRVCSEGFTIPKEEAPLSDVAAEAIRTLDLRKMPCGKKFKARMQSFKKRYPNLEKLRLPPLVLDQKHGAIIRSMDSVTKLDLTFCDISNPASLQYLPKGLQAFHYGDPSEGHHMLWEGNSCKDSVLNVHALPEEWKKKHDAIPQFTDDHALHLAKFEHLEVVDISIASQLTATGIKMLAPLKGLQTLGIIESKKLDDASFALFPTQFPELQELYCGYNNISDPGIGFLSNLKKLHTLIIGPQSQVTTEGWKQLTSCTSLKRLCVTMTGGLTDDVVLELCKLSQLEVLYIAKATKLSTRVRLTLVLKLPHCKVHLD
ncbi:MAG: hypothetical protein JWO53_984 [Chlamydiia bacterium]|nr:hypothetical protein [Chlamydiia bacterium]